MIYLELLLTFLKIGAFTFGGGHAMLPLIQEQVISHGWVSSEELINFIAISESTPGPFAVNISTYVGVETGGVLGAICATFGVTFPSFVIILIIANYFEKFKENKIIKGGISGLRPAVVGLIAVSVVTTAKLVFLPTEGLRINSWLISAIIIFAIMMILSAKKVNPIVIIITSAVLGIIVGYLQG